MSDKNVRIVHDMFDGARTRIKSSGGLTDKIPVGVGMISKHALIHAHACS